METQKKVSRQVELVLSVENRGVTVWKFSLSYCDQNDHGFSVLSWYF